MEHYKEGYAIFNSFLESVKEDAPNCYFLAKVMLAACDVNDDRDSVVFDFRGYIPTRNGIKRLEEWIKHPDLDVYNICWEGTKPSTEDLDNLFSPSPGGGYKNFDRVWGLAVFCLKNSQDFQDHIRTEALDLPALREFYKNSAYKLEGWSTTKYWSDLVIEVSQNRKRNDQTKQPHK